MRVIASLLFLVQFSWTASASDKQIIGTDDRVRIKTLDEAFHATVGMIEYEGSPNTYCTGTLITPRHVLTSGHCVVSSREAPTVLIDPARILFTPGRLVRGGVPFGSMKAVAIHTFDEWLSTRRGQWDVAVIELEGELLEPQIKLHPLRYPDIPQDVRLLITGYSAGKPYGSMWEGPGDFLKVLENGQQFHHSIDTQPGTSGALIRYRSNDEWYLFGVHRGTAWPVLNINTGILLNEHVYDAVIEWVNR
jgi:glutamyl endopeptidase